MQNISLQEVEHYWNVVIPELERKMTTSTDKMELLELYTLYEDVLRLIAPYNFMAFNMYLELDEDHGDANRAFYHHRKEHLKDIFESLNDMEIYDKYDYLLISMPPRVGKSTVNLRFEAWVIGRHPVETQLATSYSESITASFYNGVMEVVMGERYQQVFPNCPLVNQNAKRQEIWLKELKRYPSISFVSIRGSMTGRAEASRYLFVDDLVSGIEEALSPVQLEKLWTFYTVNAKQRKKDMLDGWKKCKEIHIATLWSVHDPMNRLMAEHANNPRCKVIKKPCYDENGESAFNFFGGFSTEYYKDLEATMDKASFDALYRCEPVEREGLLYHDDEMQYYFELPKERPDAIIAICDSKNLGKDYVSSPIGYVYGDFVYVEDVVYNPGLPEITRPLVAGKWVAHNVTRADVELNNGGNYYAEDLEKLVKEFGGKTSIRVFYTSQNKTTKIISFADYVKKYFIFKHPSTYHKQSEYATFMRDVFRWTQTGNNPHDDSVDSLAMLAQLKQDLEGASIKILSRQKLGI